MRSGYRGEGGGSPHPPHVIYVSRQTLRQWAGLMEASPCRGGPSACRRPPATGCCQLIGWFCFVLTKWGASTSFLEGRLFSLGGLICFCFLGGFIFIEGGFVRGPLLIFLFIIISSDTHNLRFFHLFWIMKVSSSSEIPGW